MMAAEMQKTVVGANNKYYLSYVNLTTIANFTVL